MLGPTWKVNALALKNTFAFATLSPSKGWQRLAGQPLRRHALSSSPVQLPHAEQQQHPPPALSSPEGSPSTQLSTQYCMVQAEAYRCDSAASLTSDEYSHLQICTNLRVKGFS